MVITQGRTAVVNIMQYALANISVIPARQTANHSHASDAVCEQVAKMSEHLNGNYPFHFSKHMAVHRAKITSFFQRLVQFALKTTCVQSSHFI